MEMTDMNSFNFIGRLAAAPAMTGSGDRAVTKFKLIQNRYAGKDEAGDALETVVAIQFTAFRGRAEAIAKNCFKGDQLAVTAHVQNNNYSKDGVDMYDFNFLVDEFEFCAPGEAKRQELAGRQAAHA
jgi:single-strand DNA-binding protein